MGERRGTKGLELWCKRMTEGYPGVKVDNMTTSWRDGLAFCAIIHHFRPDLIDFSKLNKNDIYNNNELAFRIAEDHLGIPALLEPEDMVEYSVPDRLSILTYLSQFYQAFAVNQTNSPTKIAPKRAAPKDLQMHMVSASTSSPPKKNAMHVFGARREPCTKCDLPVFIAERLNIGKSLYHRTCFRCARCDSQLTIGNYYETENGEFCCETCPDEEKPPKVQHDVLNRSLSDEEKSASLKGDSDPYSSNFENVLEDPGDDSLRRNFTLDGSIISKFVTARSDFLNTQMNFTQSEIDSDTSEENKPPDLPPSDDPRSIHSENNEAVCNNMLPSLSDSGLSCKQNDQHITDPKRCESQPSVTKDSISINFQSPTPSIRSRIELFEGADDRVDEIKKSDVNRESLSVSEVPSEGHEETANESFEEEIPNSRRNSDSKVQKESVISFMEDSQIEPSTHSDSYQADVSQVTDFTSPSAPCELETSMNISYPSNENGSVITISSTEDSNRPPVDESLVTDVIIIPSSDVSDSKICDQVESVNELEISSRVSDEESDYPVDLNPFGEEEHEVSGKAPTASLNPFGDTDEEDIEISEQLPVAAPRKLIRVSNNPFESDDENGEEVSSLPPQPAVRKLLRPSKITLGQLYSDSPPEIRFSSPGRSTPDRSPLIGSGRKKKPAPKPPTAASVFKQDPNESPFSSLASSPSQSVCHSPKGTIRSKKLRRAPLPPSSTPLMSHTDVKHPEVSPIVSSITYESKELKPLTFRIGSEENLKDIKDESNRNRQHGFKLTQNDGPSSLPNKSTYGKWKRRKGPAPARPVVVQRKIVKPLGMNEIKHELELIETQQLGLEKQGVKLETLIREKSEAPGTNQDENLAPEVEDMILQLFELVNEKNELFRRQTELMYLRREHRLEEEQAEIDNQLRLLWLQPDANKTDSDKFREEELISRKLEIVERRNEIIDCLEMDRQREAQEDTSIRTQLSLFSMKREEDSGTKKKSKKEKHKRKKDKERKSKNKTDIDKDIDESEIKNLKEKKKKKILNLF